MLYEVITNIHGNEGQIITMDVLANDQDPDFDTNPAGDELTIIAADYAPGELNTFVGVIIV